MPESLKPCYCPNCRKYYLGEVVDRKQTRYKKRVGKNHLVVQYAIFWCWNCLYQNASPSMRKFLSKDGANEFGI